MFEQNITFSCTTQLDSFENIVKINMQNQEKIYFLIIACAPIKSRSSLS